jgi:serine/threonine protein kinase
MALETGTRLGPYDVLSLIGTGGMGEVYRARETRPDHTVALKILAPRAAQIGSQSGELWLCLNARPARAYCSVHRVDRLPFCLRRSKVGPSGLSCRHCDLRWSIPNRRSQIATVCKGPERRGRLFDVTE